MDKIRNFFYYTSEFEFELENFSDNLSHSPPHVFDKRIDAYPLVVKSSICVKKNRKKKRLYLFENQSNEDPSLNTSQTFYTN